MTISFGSSKGSQTISLPRLPRILVVAVLTLASVVGCRCAYENNYTPARDRLNADISVLPLPPESEILARYDGVSTGQVEACRSVTTELLVGSELSTADLYQFYRDELTALGWEVALDLTSDETPALALERDGGYGMEITSNCYVSTGISHSVINGAEAQFETLVLIGIGYSVYGPDKCQDAIDKADR